MASEFLRFINIRKAVDDAGPVGLISPPANLDYQLIKLLTSADSAAAYLDEPRFGITLPLTEKAPSLGTAKFVGIRNRLIHVAVELANSKPDFTSLDGVADALNEAEIKPTLLAAAWDYFAFALFEPGQPAFRDARMALVGAEVVTRRKVSGKHWRELVEELPNIDFYIPIQQNESSGIGRPLKKLKVTHSVDPDSPTKLIAVGDRTLIAPNLIETVKYEEDRTLKTCCCNLELASVANFHRLEYELLRYEPGEISHIENLMQGEFKERLTRYLNRYEEENVLEQESEQETSKDTQTTERLELERETQKQFSAALEASGSYTGSTANGVVTASTSASISSSTSVRELSKSMQEIVSKATQRVKTRTLNRRTTKQLEEFEDTSKHGLDNRGGSNHVTGIYRWLDKVLKVDLIDYGRRICLDLVIETPARQFQGSIEELIVRLPTEPKDVIFGGKKLTDASVITETNYRQFAAAYDAQVKAPPPQVVQVTKSLHVGEDSEGTSSGPTVPDGYIAVTSKAVMEQRGKDSDNDTILAFGVQAGQDVKVFSDSGLSIVGETSFSFGAKAFASVGSLMLTCNPTSETMDNWRLDVYNAIIAAYNDKVAVAERKLVAAKRTAAARTPQHPAKNKRIVEEELRKLCIWSIVCGLDFWQQDDWSNHCEDSVNPRKALLPTNSEANCKSGRLAKLLESIVDWQLMTYRFLPYYWAPACRWEDMLATNDLDPLFEEFLKAGAARISVPVAVGQEGVRELLYLIHTGNFWDAKIPPPLVGSAANLAAEADVIALTDPKVIDSWEVRLPTSLTLLECGNGCVNSSQVSAKITGLDTTGGPMKPTPEQPAS